MLFLRIYPKEMLMYVFTCAEIQLQRHSLRMVIIANKQTTTTKKRETPKCPIVGEMVKKFMECRKRENYATI